jgi:hypothetical protein
MRKIGKMWKYLSTTDKEIMRTSNKMQRKGKE